MLKHVCNNKLKYVIINMEARDYKPVEVENEYEIKLNEKYIIKTTKVSYIKDGKMLEEEREVLSFNIIEVNDDNIKINTYQAFSDNENGTINLRTDKKEFIITTEKPLKLITPTMDYGEIFIFTLVK